MIYESSRTIFKTELGDQNPEMYYQDIPNGSIKLLKSEQNTFWTRVLKNWILSKEVAEFDQEILEQYLVHDEFIPPLDDSVQQLLNEKILFNKTDYLEQKSFFRQIFGKLFTYTPHEGIKQYICQSNLHMLINRIYNQFITNANTAIDLIVTNDQMKEYLPSISQEVIQSGFNYLKLAAKYEHGYYLKSSKFKKFDDDAVISILNIKNIICSLSKINKKLQSNMANNSMPISQINIKKNKIKQLFDYLHVTLIEINENKTSIPVCHTINVFSRSNSLFIDEDISINHPIFNLSHKNSIEEKEFIESSWAL